jgi:uncharacterized protein YndB with AHSA1/START domain
LKKQFEAFTIKPYFTKNGDNMTKVADVKRQDLVITRFIDAPLELVWKAWTEAEQVKRWWGPKDYTSPTCKLDLQVGGSFLFAMRAPADRAQAAPGILSIPGR